jgi:hypothetical protein
MLDEILGWDYDKLEEEHNYIQTLFPLPEKSGNGVQCALIDEKVFTQFRNPDDPTLRQILRSSFERMLGFFGFTIYGRGNNMTVRYRIVGVTMTT